MTTLTEGNLRITVPRGARARKFDDKASHELSHCMKAVDLIVEEADRVLFIEIKDPGHPRAKQQDRAKFVDSFRSERLDEDLKYKYRDTFLYEWATGNSDKPIHYWVIVAIDELTDADLLTRTNDLRRKLPLQGPPSGKWKRRIVADCIVFNLRTWMRHCPDFPVSRIGS